jgi:hypothetical protein
LAAGGAANEVFRGKLDTDPAANEAVAASANRLVIPKPARRRAGTTPREDRPVPYTISRVDVWTREIDDTVGGLAATLEPLARAGVDLSYLIARRRTLVPGKGVVFLGGISGPKGAKAAAAAGLSRATGITGLRVEGANKRGDCHRVTRLLADSGINLRGVSASVIGRKYVLILAFDNANDAATAARLLRSAGK